MQTEQVIERVGRVGFDRLAVLGQPETIRFLLKLFEITDEAHRKSQLGELLIAVTSLAHQAGIDAESALREALARFRVRFGAMEAEALESGRALLDLSAEEKQGLWDAAVDAGDGEASP